MLILAGLAFATQILHISKEYAQNIVKNMYKICALERDYLQGQGGMDSN